MPDLISAHWCGHNNPQDTFFKCAQVYNIVTALVKVPQICSLLDVTSGSEAQVSSPPQTETCLNCTPATDMQLAIIINC